MGVGGVGGGGDMLTDNWVTQVEGWSVREWVGMGYREMEEDKARGDTSVLSGILTVCLEWSVGPCRLGEGEVGLEEEISRGRERKSTQCLLRV